MTFHQQNPLYDEIFKNTKVLLFSYFHLEMLPIYVRLNMYKLLVGVSVRKKQI